MGLKFSEWAVLLCVCVFGIQESYQFMAEMREINQNCFRNGGFCINVIPPPPPRRRQNQQRRRMRTNTRRGSRGRRPSPEQVGASHTRLPASAQGTGAQNYPPQQPPANQPPSPYDTFTPIGQMGVGAGVGGAMNAGTSHSQSPFDSMFPFFMFTRKKRQAPAMDPEAAAEIPRIGRGQNMYQYLDLHCRKTEFDFGCRDTGGICCLPHP